MADPNQKTSIDGEDLELAIGQAVQRKRGLLDQIAQHLRQVEAWKQTVAGTDAQLEAMRAAKAAGTPYAPPPAK